MLIEHITSRPQANTAWESSIGGPQTDFLKRIGRFLPCTTVHYPVGRCERPVDDHRTGGEGASGSWTGTWRAGASGSSTPGAGSSGPGGVGGGEGGGVSGLGVL